MADPNTPSPTDYFDPWHVMQALRAAGPAVAPNITSLLKGEPDKSPYPSMTPTAGGKIPSSADPRISGAVQEGMGLAGSAIGGMGGGGLAARGATEAMPAAEAAMSQTGRSNQLIRNLLMGGSQTAMDPTPAQGATRLLPDERRAVEVEKQKSQNAAQAAMQQKQAETEAEVEKQKALGQNQLEQQKQQADFQKQQTEAQKQQEQEENKRQANMPFRERHKDLTAALPMIGDAASIGIPMMASLLSKGKLGKMAGAWQGAADKGTSFLDANPKKMLPAALAKELQSHMEQWGKHSDPVGTVGHITGAMAPLEASMFPMESDAMTLPPDAPDKWALMHQDPKELAMRAGSAGLQGLPFATAGKLLGGHMVTPAVPTAQTQGLLARASKAKPR
jgi:hypothetical protein